MVTFLLDRLQAHQPQLLTINMTLDSILEKHPSIGIIASGAGAGAGVKAVFDGMTTILTFLSVVAGLGVGYYTLRIQRKKYLDSLAYSAPRVEKKVLIVEDDAVVGDCLRRGLESAGYAAHLVRSGEDAINLVDRSFCCVILDLSLPDIHGIHVLSRINSLAIGLPVIVVSGENDVKNALKAVKLGAIDYIIKPFSVPPLVKLVDSLWKLGGVRQHYTRMRDSLATGPHLNEDT